MERIAFVPQSFEYAVRDAQGDIIGIGNTPFEAAQHACRQAANYPLRCGMQCLTRNTREAKEPGWDWWEVVGEVEVTKGERRATQELHGKPLHN